MRTFKLGPSLNHEYSKTELTFIFHPNEPFFINLLFGIIDQIYYNVSDELSLL